jgi:hypothetical protein
MMSARRGIRRLLTTVWTVGVGAILVLMGIGSHLLFPFEAVPVHGQIVELGDRSEFEARTLEEQGEAIRERYRVCRLRASRGERPITAPTWCSS